MQFVLLIYQGTTPMPGTPEWSSLTQAEQKAIYADYAAFSQRPDYTEGLPLGLPEDAKTVRVDNGAILTADGPTSAARTPSVVTQWSMLRTSTPRS